MLQEAEVVRPALGSTVAEQANPGLDQGSEGGRRSGAEIVCHGHGYRGEGISEPSHEADWRAVLDLFELDAGRDGRDAVRRGLRRGRRGALAVAGQRGCQEECGEPQALARRLNHRTSV